MIKQLIFQLHFFIILINIIKYVMNDILVGSFCYIFIKRINIMTDCKNMFNLNRCFNFVISTSIMLYNTFKTSQILRFKKNIKN